MTASSTIQVHFDEADVRREHQAPSAGGPGYNTLDIIDGGTVVYLHFRTPALIDRVIAELVALRAEMAPPAPRGDACACGCPERSHMPGGSLGDWCGTCGATACGGYVPAEPAPLAAVAEPVGYEVHVRAEDREPESRRYCESTAPVSGFRCTEQGPHDGHRNGLVTWGPGAEPTAASLTAEREMRIRLGYSRLAHLTWFEREHPDAPEFPDKPRTEEATLAVIRAYCAGILAESVKSGTLVLVDDDEGLCECSHGQGEHDDEGDSDAGPPAVVAGSVVRGPLAASK